jgi:hypothetical protein
MSERWREPLADEPEAVRRKFATTKERLAERALRVFGDTGAEVQLIGSAKEDSPDFFSDVDISVVHEDEKIREIVKARYELYDKIHPVSFTWERPRFAPLGGGKHSIVMFDTEPVLTEMDVFLFPESHYSTTYRGFGEKGRTFEWEEGEDLTDKEAKLNYLLCVSYWALKYVSRGEGDRIEWLMQRYEETRAYVPDLADLSRDDFTGKSELEAVELIIGIIHDSVSDEDKTKTGKLKVAASLGIDACQLSFDNPQRKS